MNEKEEKWAIFWCDLLGPIIHSDIKPEQTHQCLVQIASRKVQFPNGQIKKPSLSTLKRKLKKYQQGGFFELFRKGRSDRGKARVVSDQIIDRAIELKKEQGRRSDVTINRFLEDEFGIKLSRSTLYWHLKNAGATRIKLGITKAPVRGRWSREHTHDLWVGDFSDGPWVIDGNEIVATYLSAFIDCHSRYGIEAEYYYRHNLDVLIDSLIQALSKHGAPWGLYLDNAKVYHSHGLKMACHIMATRLIHRPKGDPAPGGIIERFIQTIQDQFEAEVRAGEILTLEQLNRAFSAWLSVGYHKQIHSEIKNTPEDQYQKGLKAIRKVDMQQILRAFMHRIIRTVHRQFSDVRINNRFFKVAPELRGDKVEVAYDPFTPVDTVEIYSLDGRYQGTGTLHFREPGSSVIPEKSAPKPDHNYLELLKRQHQQLLESETKGIDYRKSVSNRAWPFHEFARTFAGLLGRKGGLTSFCTDELERLKKVYNLSRAIDKKMLKRAFENACSKTMPYIIHELKQLIKTKEDY
jgi:transposase InsO family protein